MLSASAAPVGDGGPIAGVQDLGVATKDIPDLRSQALLGSGDAAFRLYRYYDFVVLDQKQAEYWLAIAAENGNALAQFNYSYKLAKNTNADDQLRAIYWAELVVKNENDTSAVDAAKSFLKEHTRPIGP